MPDITVTISIADWRDVDVNDAEQRRVILRAIGRAAEIAADEKAELYDVVIKTNSD